jgi:FMN-dependent NADH-azoreductase
MTTILAVRSSILGAASVSNRLLDQAIGALSSNDPSIRIIERDLAANPIPHFDAAAAGGTRADAVTPAEQQARALSELLINEVQSADILLIGAPMYNFGIASTLKSWFDYLIRAGVTFSYSEAGPKGLLTGKRAIVVQSRGGHYPDGPAKAMDSQEPHLRTLLGFVGITDIDFVLADRLAFGPEARDAAIYSAQAGIARSLRRTFGLAA